MIFDGFRVEHVPKEIKKLKGNKNITINIYKIQASDSVICRYFCIRLGLLILYQFIFPYRLWKE